MRTRISRLTEVGPPRRSAVVGILVVAFAVASAGGAAAASLPGPTGPLTATQLSQLLPADSDIPGFTHSDSDDASGRQTKQDIVSGGAACQKFIDATEGLTGTYGTVSAASRTFHQRSGGREVLVIILSFVSPNAAKAVLADIQGGLDGCTAFTGTYAGHEFTDVVAPVAALAGPDSTGYVTEQISGSGGLAGTEVVQVGSTIVEVSALSPPTQDSDVMGDMGAQVGAVSFLVVGRLAQTSS